MTTIILPVGDTRCTLIEGVPKISGGLVKNVEISVTVFHCLLIVS